MARERSGTSPEQTDRRTFMRLCGATLAVGATGAASKRTSAHAVDETATSEGAAFGNVLVIIGQAGVSNYEMTVSDRMVPGLDAGALSTTGARGASAEGAVGVGTHSYWFSGNVTDFRFDGAAAVYLNGERVDPSTLGEAV